MPNVHVAFYGGSFTAIPMEEQVKYLKIAHEYKTNGFVSEIHLSTRPDCIDDEVLENLKNYSVDLIELGCQSFDDDVLSASKRGHNTKDIYRACSLIQSAGFKLGIQLMVGLPKSTRESDILSAHKTVEIMPDVARIYPTIVIEDTELLDMVKLGEYKPLTLDEAAWRSKEMLRVLNVSGVNVIRIGLKASDLISGDGKFTGTTFHPAFRQLVEGSLARESIEEQLLHLFGNQLRHQASDNQKLRVIASANPASFSNLVGHKAENRKYFVDKYTNMQFLFRVDNSLAVGEYFVEIEKL